ncbi:predicted protein [Nematostella vectensis]|uniref:Uncharacterized protein n=1 Tax=Nematostella vectensis TaxID=45351 RepID=A7RSQ5_NEMVE|nr:predicted protein [Nematostella vectensis]|eukprot:XP_001637562.1 predicted protein [Nematostella vectensis]
MGLRGWRLGEVLIGVVGSLTRSDVIGITYLYTPTRNLQNLSLWVDAASQNAWDTGAGMGVSLVYGTYMTRSNAVVKAGLLLPIVNNLIRYIMPLEAIVLAVFWVYHNHCSWSKFVKDSLLIAVIQWVVLLIALFLINWGWMRWRRSRQRIYVTRPSLHSYGSTEPIPPRPILHEEDSTGDEHPKPDKRGDIVRGARDESRPRSTTKRKKSRHRERPRRTDVEDYFRGSGDKNGRQENDGPRITSTDNTPRKTGVENSPRGNDIENKPRGTGTEYNLRSTDDKSRTRGIDDENRPRGTDDESRPRGTDAESRPRGIDDESGPRGTDDESRPRGTDAKIIPLGTGAAQNEPTPSDGTCAETGEPCTHIAVEPRGGFAESSSLDEHGPPVGAVTSGDSEECVSRDNVSIKSDHYQP